MFCKFRCFACLLALTVLLGFNVGADDEPPAPDDTTPKATDTPKKTDDAATTDDTPAGKLKALQDKWTELQTKLDDLLKEYEEAKPTERKGHSKNSKDNTMDNPQRSFVVRSISNRKTFRD